MSRYLLPKDNYQKDPSGSGVFITCPGCKKSSFIDTTGSPESHAIDESSGDVSPSLDCPNDDCSFHEFVTLEDWK